MQKYFYYLKKLFICSKGKSKTNYIKKKSYSTCTSSPSKELVMRAICVRISTLTWKTKKNGVADTMLTFLKRQHCFFGLYYISILYSYRQNFQWSNATVKTYQTVWLEQFYSGSIMYQSLFLLKDLDEMNSIIVGTNSFLESFKSDLLI